jgi:hypothetical protein
VASRRRSGWSRLTPGYRAYLRRKGFDRKRWESGEPVRRVKSRRAYYDLYASYRARLFNRYGIGEGEWREGYTAKREPPPPTPRGAHELARLLLEDPPPTLTTKQQRDIDRWRDAHPRTFSRFQGEQGRIIALVLWHQKVRGVTQWDEVVPSPRTAPTPWPVNVLYIDGSSQDFLIPSSAMGTFWFMLSEVFKEEYGLDYRPGDSP